MNPTTFQLWFGVLAGVLHLILGSLSTDGGASLLARYDIDARLPPKAIPVTVLVCSVAAGVVDNLVNGVDVQHAFATAITVAIASVGGAAAHHALVSSGAASGIALLGAGVLALVLAACTPAQLRQAESAALDFGTCLVAKQDVSDEQALAECGITEAKKQLLAKQQLHAMREETSKHAAAAARIAAHDAKVGCAHGGAP